jgi:hypothetical protein
MNVPSGVEDEWVEEDANEDYDGYQDDSELYYTQLSVRRYVIAAALVYRGALLLFYLSEM